MSCERNEKSLCIFIRRKRRREFAQNLYTFCGQKDFHWQLHKIRLSYFRLTLLQAIRKHTP